MSAPAVRFPSRCRTASPTAYLPAHEDRTAAVVSLVRMPSHAAIVAQRSLRLRDPGRVHPLKDGDVALGRERVGVMLDPLDGPRRRANPPAPRNWWSRAIRDVATPAVE